MKTKKANANTDLVFKVASFAIGVVLTFLIAQQVIDKAPDCYTFGGYCAPESLGCSKETTVSETYNCRNFVKDMKKMGDEMQDDEVVCCISPDMEGKTDLEKEREAAANYNSDCAYDITKCELSVDNQDSMTIDQVKTALVNTPLYDHAQLIIDESKRINMDASIILAMFKHESAFGTSGAGKDNKNPGNLRYTKRCKEEYEGTNNNGFCKYPDWATGVRAYTELMEKFYLGEGKDTLGKIINKYAPCVENNQKAYAESVVAFVSPYINTNECALT
ncbi:MAG: glucosaminidase domain-containing protein [Candidatus Woesearchaeota archaeon]